MGTEDDESDKDGAAANDGERASRGGGRWWEQQETSSQPVGEGRMADKSTARKPRVGGPGRRLQKFPSIRVLARFKNDGSKY